MIDTVGTLRIEENLLKNKLIAGHLLYKKWGRGGIEVVVPTCLFAGNEVFIGLERFDPNTADLHDVLRLFERTILFPIVDDSLGIRWPDALQGGEFRH